MGDENEDQSTWLRPARDVYDSRAMHCVKNSSDMPVGVQVVALPWRDELCLSVMREIEGACDVDMKPPAMRSFVESWPGPQPEGMKPGETTPLLANGQQDWREEMSYSFATKIRRLLRIPHSSSIPVDSFV